MAAGIHQATRWWPRTQIKHLEHVRYPASAKPSPKEPMGWNLSAYRAELAEAFIVYANGIYAGWPRLEARCEGGMLLGCEALL